MIVIRFSGKIQYCLFADTGAYDNFFFDVAHILMFILFLKMIWSNQ